MKSEQAGGKENILVSKDQGWRSPGGQDAEEDLWETCAS